MITRKVVNWARGAKRAIAHLNVAAVRLHGAALDRQVEKKFVQHDKLCDSVSILRAAAQELGYKANAAWHEAVEFEGEVIAERKALGLPE